MAPQTRLQAKKLVDEVDGICSSMALVAQPSSTNTDGSNTAPGLSQALPRRSANIQRPRVVNKLTKSKPSLKNKKPASAPHTKPYKPFKKFPQFSKFPQEVQDLVWYYSLPRPDFKEGRYDSRNTLKDTSLYIKNTMFPVHLRICHDSRNIFLKHYTPVLGKPAKVFARDHVFVHNPRDPETDLGPFIQYLTSETAIQNRFLMLNDTYDETNGLTRIYGPRKMYIDPKHDVVYFNSYSFINAYCLSGWDCTPLIAGLSGADRINLRHVALDFEVLGGGLNRFRCSLVHYDMNASCRDQVQRAIGNAFKALNCTFMNLETLTIVAYQYATAPQLLYLENRTSRFRHEKKLAFFDKLFHMNDARNNTKMWGSPRLRSLMCFRDEEQSSHSTHNVDAEPFWEVYKPYYEEIVRCVARDRPDMNLRIPKILWKFASREGSVACPK